MPCLVQPLDGKSSPDYVWEKDLVCKRGGYGARSSPDAQTLRLGFLGHVSCSYRKGFIRRYDIYSSCVSDSTGFFGFLFL